LPLKADPFLLRFEPLRAARINRPWLGYVVAVAGVGAALAVRAVIPADAAPFTTFYPVIIAATLLGGWRPGLVAVAASTVVADWFLIPPVGSFSMSPGSLWSEGLFLVITVTIVAIVTLLNEALDRLHAQSENLHVVIETEPAGIIAVDGEGRIELVNKTAEQQFGYTREELYGQPIEVLAPEDSRREHLTLRALYLRKPIERRMGGPGIDLNGRRKDGTLFPIEVGLNPLQRGAIKGALSTIIDISERRNAERRQQILTNEVRHRGRNLLAMVQAIAMQTIPANERKEFMEALKGLARTQDLFLDAEVAPLLKIIDTELLPFHNRVSVGGCDITLLPRAAQDFCLIIHELTTNSAKYGALSAPGGKIKITGDVSGGVFTFVWEEMDGPPPHQPAHTGLGHVILHDVAHAFCDRVQTTYGDKGFRYEIAARMEKLNSNVIDLAGKRGAEAS
jgi:PAS domain S-box-containing protein